MHKGCRMSPEAFNSRLKGPSCCRTCGNGQHRCRQGYPPNDPAALDSLTAPPGSFSILRLTWSLSLRNPRSADCLVQTRSSLIVPPVMSIKTRPGEPNFTARRLVPALRLKAKGCGQDATSAPQVRAIAASNLAGVKGLRSISTPAGRSRIISVSA